MRRGYLDMPAETAIVLSTDGWLSTGGQVPKPPIAKILRRRLKEEQAASVGGNCAEPGQGYDIVSPFFPGSQPDRLCIDLYSVVRYLQRRRILAQQGEGDAKGKTGRMSGEGQ